MGRTEIRNASIVATFDSQRRELRGATVEIEDGVIVAVDEDDAGTIIRSTEPDRIIDATGLILLPGLVNTHHHFFQTLTRNLPASQDARLFDWLVAHYPLWARIDPESLYSASQVAACELLLSGCTTSSDHTYLWPNGATIDDEMAAVSDIGLRFHAARGSMSLGVSDGGLPPDSVVEREDTILRDTQRAIERYHDPDRYAMTRVVVAPCSPFSVTPDLMQRSAELARAYGVHLHTHLAETREETSFCLDYFGMTPVEFAEQVGWTGDDVWFAHMVHPSAKEIERLGAAECGAAHCPCSNMRLGSGIAPIGHMIRAGMRVGLGVDGSASNDSSNMLAETRQAMLLQRLYAELASPRSESGRRGSESDSDTGEPVGGHSPDEHDSWLTAREVLTLATRGGAEVLGRDDIGSIEVGKAADIIGFRLDSLPLSGGAVHDPLASLAFCTPSRVDLSVVAGEVTVRDGELCGVDVAGIVDRHNTHAKRLVEAHGK